MYIGKSVSYEERLLKEVFPQNLHLQQLLKNGMIKENKKSLNNGQEIYFIGITADTLFYNYPLNLIR